MDIFDAFRAVPAFYWVVAGVAGTMMGSFLNVVIHRLPRMMEADWRQQCREYLHPEEEAQAPASPRYNLIVPRSACPHCGHRIRAVENIPIASYVALGGRCTACKAPIGIRYPIVEALTGVLTAFMAWKFGVTATAAAAIVFTWALIALAFIDADTTLLPDDVTLPLLWLGLIVNLFGLFTSLPAAVLGAIAGYLALWSVYWAFKLATGKEGMGYGDFKLLAAIGAWLGWQMLPQVILLSAAVGAVVGIIGILLWGRERGARIPFGPYLAAAGFLALAWGRDINAWYWAFGRS